jgi:hypothetical protein
VIARNNPAAESLFRHWSMHSGCEPGLQKSIGGYGSALRYHEASENDVAERGLAGDAVNGRIAHLWEPALAGEWFGLNEPVGRPSAWQWARSDYA